MDHNEHTISVTDDSGLLSLVDAGAYRSFLSEDWTYEGLLQHFIHQMDARTLLVWECGDGGGTYTISTRRTISQEKGFREVSGGIIVTGDRLQITSYDALTMAAQFADEVLPTKREIDAFISLPAGPYRVRIVQMFDPMRASETPAPDFLLEIESGSAVTWRAVPWIKT